MQHRSSAFDFPLRFMLQAMCNNLGSIDMWSLDHAGLSGVDPLGAVTFVENHDTDKNSPVVRNKMLAYAYILTAEGYPCVFYRDYSTDTTCFGLKPSIDRLIWIHENLANGPTTTRWNDPRVIVTERLGGPGLLTALKANLSAWQDGLAEVGWNSLYWDNHDQPRIVSRWGDDREHRVASAKSWATVLHLLRGTPYVYQGEELGMTNAHFTSLDSYHDIESVNWAKGAIAA